ncbi:hypothetical protein F4678DRAFT_442994 [Xylaria arbuscula]|nr:hypothetical protein F4678DRAFT_442994 [Xylaria arbuscula]
MVFILSVIIIKCGLSLFDTLWNLFGFCVAVVVVMIGATTQYSSVMLVDQPELSAVQFKFTNAVSLGWSTDLNTSTINFRVFMEGSQPAIKYVTISSDILSLGKRIDPESNIAEVYLPALPLGDWTTADIGFAVDGELIKVTQTSAAPLPGVKNIWHPDFYDILDFGIIAAPWFSTRVKLVTHPSLKTPGNKAVLKFAEFSNMIPQINTETGIYEHLVGYGIAPQFIAHVTENNGARVVGFLVQYIEDARRVQKDTYSDLAVEKCKATLSKLHQYGITHNDAHPNNCLIQRDGSAILIDFEFATRGKANSELDYARMDEPF